MQGSQDMDAWSTIGQWARRMPARNIFVAWLFCSMSLGVLAGSLRECQLPRHTPQELQALDVAGWLDRMRQATDLNTYSGVFVVMSSSGMMSSARVWHVCAGQGQIERLEALTGKPRIVYRQNAEVRTFMPNERVVRIESREMLRKWARTKGIDAESLSAHYAAQLGQGERVADKDTDLLQLRPRDAARFGYRVWLDHASGLVLKWQTVAPSGRVLEQAAFSELDMDAPHGGAQLEAMMNDVVGYRVVSETRVPTTLEAAGWALPVPVDGFVLLNCSHAQSQNKDDDRAARAASRASLGVQCVYSDGLANISVFLEPYSEEAHPYPGQELRLGATHTLSARVAGDTWVTMVGEVPLSTLHRFASAIKQTSP